MNVLFWKPQVALFVDEVTLLPVVMPFAPGTGNYEGLYYYQWVFGTFEPPWPTQA